MCPLSRTRARSVLHRRHKLVQDRGDRTDRGDSLFSPGTQGLGVLEEILRDLIVLHCSAGVAEGTSMALLN